MDAIKLSDFDESTVDKVLRLLELLDEMERHPALRGKFALHGGTAINLFMLDVPRLSVDIDISYIGSASKEEMLHERPALEDAIRTVGGMLGYQMPPTSPEHAGTTFLLNYRGPRRPDHVKIDAVYMNRVPLAGVAMRRTPLSGNLRIRSFSDAELIGGKVKAFFDRVKVRDLYDISNLRRHLAAIDAASEEGQALHKIVLYYATLSARFPFGFEGREERFASLSRDVEEQLYPMLRKSSDRQILASMMADAASFVKEWVMPRSNGEIEFLRRFEDGDYEPSLLFDEAGVTERARRSPQALWKAENLKKMDSTRRGL